MYLLHRNILHYVFYNIYIYNMVIQWDINGDNVNKAMRDHAYFHYTIPIHDKIGDGGSYSCTHIWTGQGDHNA